MGSTEKNSPKNSWQMMCQMFPKMSSNASCKHQWGCGFKLHLNLQLARFLILSLLRSTQWSAFTYLSSTHFLLKFKVPIWSEKRSYRKLTSPRQRIRIKMYPLGEAKLIVLPRGRKQMFSSVCSPNGLQEFLLSSR